MWSFEQSNSRHIDVSMELTVLSSIQVPTLYNPVQWISKSCFSSFWREFHFGQFKQGTCLDYSTRHFAFLARMAWGVCLMHRLNFALWAVCLSYGGMNWLAIFSHLFDKESLQKILLLFTLSTAGRPFRFQTDTL